MAWRRLGGKPLSELMMVRLRRIYVSLGLNELTIHISLYYVWVAPVLVVYFCVLSSGLKALG